MPKYYWLKKTYSNIRFSMCYFGNWFYKYTMFVEI